MAPFQAPPGPKPAPGHGRAKPRRSKRTIALARQRKRELMKQIAKLELHQELGDEKAEHDATKAMADRFRLQHRDLVKRLDEAETAVAKAESRAWDGEKEIIKLRESLCASRAVAQNNEAYIALMADQIQQLEDANTRIIARTARREGEFRREIKVLEEQARCLEQSLSIAYKNVQEYGIVFQKNTQDWAELASFLNEHSAGDSDRIQGLEHSVLGFHGAIEWLEEEANRLFQDAEERIARNRLRGDEASGRDRSERLQWYGGVSRSGSRSSSEESIHRSPLIPGSPKPECELSPVPVDLSHTGIECVGPNQPDLTETAGKVPVGPKGFEGADVKPAKDDQGSLISLAPLVDDSQGDFATFYVNKDSRCNELTRGVHDKNSSWDKYAYNHQRLGNSREQIAHDSLSWEATGSESFRDGSWSIPSLSSDPTTVSGSHLSNSWFESWNHVQGQQEPVRVYQPRIRNHWSQVKSSPDYKDHMPIVYEPTLNTSRKHVRLASSSESFPVIEDQGIETTDCEVPASVVDPQMVNNEHTQGQSQEMPTFREVESKAVQTDKALLLAHPDNLAASSLKALAGTPKGPLGAGAKKRSLSVGDLPRLSGGRGAAVERMPGSWPREGISHADVDPIEASELVDAALQVLRASIEKLLRLLDPGHPQCIVYPGLMALWIWQAYENHVEWKRWQRANSFAQQLRSQYAFQTGWVDSVGYGVSQWLAFDRTLFG